MIAGHVDWNGKAAVFYELRRLRMGNVVNILRADGVLTTFRVTRLMQFAKSDFPSDLVYGNLDHAGLRLITCGGAFDRKARSYTDNIVVFADLVGSREA